MLMSLIDGKKHNLLGVCLFISLNISFTPDDPSTSSLGVPSGKLAWKRLYACGNSNTLRPRIGSLESPLIKLPWR